MSRYLAGSGKFVPVTSHATLDTQSSPVKVKPTVAGTADKTALQPSMRPRDNETPADTYKPSADSQIIQNFELPDSQPPLTGWPMPQPPEKIIDEDTPNKNTDEGVRGEKTGQIPPVPEITDPRPKLVQYAEKYLGKYWLIVIIVILYLLFRKK